jgi:uncharacterized protein (TIGR03083 family)
VTEHLEPLRAESDRFAAAIAGADPAARVPSCPDWDLRGLVAHLGRVQRFWAGVIGRGEDVEPQDPDESLRPGDGDDLVGWFRAGAEQLLAAASAAPPDRPAWTWWEAPRTAGAIARHQVQEAAVHRWDAEVATGRPGSPLDPVVAADAMDEYVHISAVELQRWTPWSGGSGVVELAPTDVAATRWVVLGDGGPVPATEAPGPPDATLYAGASDLLLLLYRRIPLESVTVTGDQALATAFVDWLVVE